MQETSPDSYTYDAEQVEKLIKEGDALYLALKGAIKALEKWETDEFQRYVEESGLGLYSFREEWPEGTEQIKKFCVDAPSVDDDLHKSLIALEEMYPDTKD